jgi:hypothetical protein
MLILKTTEEENNSKYKELHTLLSNAPFWMECKDNTNGLIEAKFIPVTSQILVGFKLCAPELNRVFLVSNHGGEEGDLTLKEAYNRIIRLLSSMRLS